MYCNDRVTYCRFLDAVESLSTMDGLGGMVCLPTAMKERLAGSVKRESYRMVEKVSHAGLQKIESGDVDQCCS